MSVAETVLTETRGRVGLLTLNRPKALNALNLQMMHEAVAALQAFDCDPAIGCMVVTGSERAFAAGADIKEMQPQSYQQMYAADWFAGWELAMMCDFILAADTARFGQPEIKLGVIPGIGGSQRLTRAIGKAKAMELCLTGRMMDAAEAERAGLVARIVPAADLLQDAIATAASIAAMSMPVAMMVKEAVNRAFETTLAEGVRFERRMFHAGFALHDQKEGMAAFAEKRPPDFTHG
jgi:enoyl-CoA hydratase